MDAHRSRDGGAATSGPGNRSSIDSLRRPLQFRHAAIRNPGSLDPESGSQSSDLGLPIRNPESRIQRRCRLSTGHASIRALGFGILDFERSWLALYGAKRSLSFLRKSEIPHIHLVNECARGRAEARKFLSSGRSGIRDPGPCRACWEIALTRREIAPCARSK